MRNVKFYFMAGLPGETDDDLKSIVPLIQEARRIAYLKRSKKPVAILVSLGIFVPKPFTPFHHTLPLPIKELRRRVRYVRSSIRSIPNVAISVSSAYEALAQTILSNESEQATDLLLWSYEHNGNWRKALKEHKRHLGKYSILIE